MKLYKLILLLSLISTPALSYDLLLPTHIGLEGEKYENLRDPYMPEEDNKWTYGAAMYSKFTLLGDRSDDWRFFFDPKLKFRSTTSQIRQGGLYFETGFEIIKDRGIRLFRRHESLHALERGRDNDRYPVLDSWVMQLEWRLN